MSQPSGSATTQDFSTPGQLILSWTAADAGPGAEALTVSFNPAHAWLVQPQFAAIQRVNVADNGRLHIFQLSTNEELVWPVEFRDLPWDDMPPLNTQQDRPDLPRIDAGFRSLRTYIRDVLNYSEELVTITSPDGEVEVMRLVGGLESFAEAAGESRRQKYWNGTLHFRRQL